MNTRDFDYIESRLLSPMDAASEAHGRLQQVSQGNLASRLMAAMQVFQDECREIRRELTQKQYRSR